MRCFMCNEPVAEEDALCMNCGTDLRLYKRILHLSNSYYNAGLYKARVRDMSGAVTCLRQSLKLNKKNIDARNLLGLIYYETGETVQALAQWVISTNHQPKKNIANSYLNEVQTNNTKLDLVDQTIKKFNQALLYCQQGSEDLAVIQLKKVLSMNPKLVRGHQLLALLYMKNEEYSKAKKALRRAQMIDSNNTVTLNYMKEIINIEKMRPGGNKKRADKMTYQSGNELIIQPTDIYKDHSAMYTVINIVIGLLVGAALMWFLVLPARTQGIRSELNKTTLELGDQIAAKTATIESLQKELEEAKAQTQEAEAGTEAQRSGVDMYDKLLEAQDLSEQGDYVQAREVLSTVNATVLSDKGQSLYSSLSATVNTEAFKSLYNSGTQAFNQSDFDQAVSDLKQIVEVDEGYEDGDALYTYARALHKSGDTETAAQMYQKVIDQYPDTKKAEDSARYLEEIRQ